jgi:hypothetical protein
VVWEYGCGGWLEAVEKSSARVEAGVGVHCATRTGVFSDPVWSIDLSVLTTDIS